MTFKNYDHINIVKLLLISVWVKDKVGMVIPCTSTPGHLKFCGYTPAWLCGLNLLANLPIITISNNQL